MTDKHSGVLLSSRTYDVLKPIVQVILPGLGTLYFALAAIWGLPASEQVVGTIAAVTVFLGLVLGLSSRSYANSDEKYDGALEVSEEDASQIHRLEITTDPADLANQEVVSFKVRKIPPGA